MEKKEFLKNSDEAILNYEVSDTVDSKGNERVDVILTIGKTQKEIEKDLENIPVEELDKNLKISFHEYEVLLSKKDLKFLLSEIKRFEKEGPDYLDEE